MLSASRNALVCLNEDSFTLKYFNNLYLVVEMLIKLYYITKMPQYFLIIINENMKISVTNYNKKYHY